MKKRRKTKKISLFARHARRFSRIKLIIFIVVISGLAAAAAGFAVYEKNYAAISKKASAASEPASSSMPARAQASTLAAFFEPAATSTSVSFSSELSYDIGVYVYSKKKVCLQ